MTAAGCSFRLSLSSVDVWKVSLECSTGTLARAQQVLSPGEKKRAGEIGFMPMRNGFVAARAVLRSLLGRYLDSEPGEIPFAYDPLGKPGLSGHHETGFSMSRSGAVAAFAFCLNTQVGIDLERLRTIPHIERVIERMFSPGEKGEIRCLPPREQQRAFLACWTRKEAYSKAIGHGILTRFDKFCVDAAPDEPRPSIRFNGAAVPDDAWVLHDLRVCEGYAAALAYRGAERHVSIFDAGSVDALLQ